MGEQAEGGGLPDLVRAVVTEPAQDTGEVADGGLQVERVEGVEAGGEIGGGGRGPVVEPDPAGVQGFLFDPGGPVRVAALDRLVHQLGQLPRRRGLVAAGGHGEVPVHEPDRLGRQAGGLGGDPAGLPGLQPARLDQVPEPRQPEAQLDRLGDQPQPRGIGEAEGGGEGLDRVLGDPRRALARPAPPRRWSRPARSRRPPAAP